MSSTLTKAPELTVDLLVSRREQATRPVLNERNRFRAFVSSSPSDNRESSFFVVDYPPAYSGRYVMLTGSHERCQAQTSVSDEWGCRIEDAQSSSDILGCIGEYADLLGCAQQLEDLITESALPGERPIELVVLRAVASFLLSGRWRLAEPDISSGPNGEVGLSWWPVEDGIVSLMFEGGRMRLSALFPRTTPEERRRTIEPREVAGDEAVSLVEGLLLVMEMQ